MEHHYGPGGAMPEHAAGEAILCICVGGRGFVKVGDETSELAAHQAAVWPAGKTHRIWTTDSSMTVLLRSALPLTPICVYPMRSVVQVMLLIPGLGVAGLGVPGL